ncbi:MAG: Lrp/AsnC family transcriptional regulator [Thermofilum sp.]
MDKLDLEILRALAENPRASCRSIARKLGVSPSTVARRIKQMTSKGVIKGFAIVLGQDFVSAASCFALLVKVKGGFEPREVGEKLKTIPELCRIYVTAGRHDIICFFSSTSRDETARIISRVKSTEGVAEVEPYTILYHVKDESFFTLSPNLLAKILPPSG